MFDPLVRGRDGPRIPLDADTADRLADLYALDNPDAEPPEEFLRSLRKDTAAQTPMAPKAVLLPGYYPPTPNNRRAYKILERAITAKGWQWLLTLDLPEHVHTMILELRAKGYIFAPTGGKDFCYVDHYVYSNDLFAKKEVPYRLYRTQLGKHCFALYAVEKR